MTYWVEEAWHEYHLNHPNSDSASINEMAEAMERVIRIIFPKEAQNE